MNPEMLSKIINSIGLVFDIVGAWYVAIEVLNQYKDNLYNTQMFDDVGNALVKKPEYEKWEYKKYLYMKIGLFMLTLGFLFQIASNWMR